MEKDKSSPAEALGFAIVAATAVVGIGKALWRSSKRKSARKAQDELLARSARSQPQELKRPPQVSQPLSAADQYSARQLQRLQEENMERARRLPFTTYT